MESPRNADLPADIIRGILLRLPVKILSQFKCVCKEWYTLIESQSFVNDHFVNESNLERLLIFKPDRHRLTYADESSSGIEEPNHLPMPAKVYDVMGPLNGVFCVVSSSGGMGLLNPALRQFRPLPLLTSCDCNLGFGLDPLSGYYKVVSIQLFWTPGFNSRTTMLPAIVHVYDSGSNSWRILDNVDMLNSMRCVFTSKFNTYLNGVYYWVIMYKGFGILAFDMGSDEFKVIQIPDELLHGGHEFELELELELAIYGDSIVLLSYTSYDRSDKFIDMWVLENEGWWTKTSTFGPFGDLRYPLGFWKNNELMIETGTTLLTMYNISTRESRDVEARGKMIGVLSIFRNWVYTYKESLVSVKGEGEGNNCKLWDLSSTFVNNFF